jgi:hypothetical protein
MGAGESRLYRCTPDIAVSACDLRKAPKAVVPPHSITARHTGSHGKLRNRITTRSYRPTGLPDGLDPGIRRRQAQKFSSHRFGAHSLIS